MMFPVTKLQLWLLLSGICYINPDLIDGIYLCFLLCFFADLHIVKVVYVLYKFVTPSKFSFCPEAAIAGRIS
jgi:hypothetical protein